LLKPKPNSDSSFKKACQLSDTQSAFIDSASYIAYFLLAIPAGKFMNRYGYKGGIILGLMLFAFGAFYFTLLLLQGLMLSFLALYL
jgi:fucose permease